jgi:hypothetical protein
VTIDGNYLQQQFAMLALEIGGNLPGINYDQLNTTGVATIAGGIGIEFVDGFLPRIGDRYDLILANGGLSMANDIEICVVGVPAAFRYSTNIAGGVFSMEVQSIPEPGCLTLSLPMALVVCLSRIAGRSSIRRLITAHSRQNAAGVT